jgi:hypothetical protein
MANNPFLIASGKVQPPPAPTPPNPSVPKVVILDPFAEGVTDYFISWEQLTALENVFIISNVTTIGPGAVTVYLPAVSSAQSGTKITIMSMSVDDVLVEPGAGSQVDGSVIYSETIKPANGVATGVVTSATYIADGQLTPQWYSLYNFIKL